MTEQQKKIGLVGLFALIIGAILYYQVIGSTGTPAPAPPPVITTAGVPGGSSSSIASRGTAAVARHAGVTAADLDPTLRMGPMLVSEALVYSGTGRNIFSGMSAPAALPQAIASARPKPGPVAAPAYLPQGPPPPPPIDLKFFGTATTAAGSRQAFLLKGEDVFLASAGDIVQRRYKVVSIAANSILIEDLVNSNRQTLPLLVN